MAVEIRYIPTINNEDIEELMGIHWSEFEFAQLAENDSYQILRLDNDYLEELEQDFDWESGKCSQRAARLLNEINLVRRIRAIYNLSEEILIFVSW